MLSEAASRVAIDPPRAHCCSCQRRSLAHCSHTTRIELEWRHLHSHTECGSRARAIGAAHRSASASASLGSTRSLCSPDVSLFPMCSVQCVRRVRAEYNEVFADMCPSAPAVRRVLDECVVGALPGRDLLGRRVLYLRSGAHSHSHSHFRRATILLHCTDPE